MYITFSFVSLLHSDESPKDNTIPDTKSPTTDIINQSIHPLLIINPDTSIKYVNKPFEKLTGFSLQELSGKKAPYPWFSKETLPSAQEDFQLIMNCNKVFFEQRYRNKNGDMFWVRISSIPVRQGAELEYCFILWVDITKRKQEFSNQFQTN